jgi:hypothetical protein
MSATAGVSAATHYGTNTPPMALIVARSHNADQSTEQSYGPAAGG